MKRALGAAAVLLAAAALAGEPEPAGYREDNYRAPVPETLAGATVLDDAAAHALWQAAAAVFVDVYPRPPKPAGLPEGTIWREKPHPSIPGAIWLPNVGYGRLAPAVDAFFRSALAEATGSDPGRPVVFFCQADCWMSWNAAKRAMGEYGYTSVFWYPDGTDGWDFEGWPMEPATPHHPPEG